MELKRCKICNQMTNYGCLKCQSEKIKKLEKENALLKEAINKAKEEIKQRG